MNNHAMKHQIFLILAAAMTLLLTACGGKKHDSGDTTAEVAETRYTALADALNNGKLADASAMADSLSLLVDELTPEQTVQVLTAFIRVHNDAVENHQSRRDLETIRKYVDVYDIALSVNPRDTRAAFEKALEINPRIDFDAIALEFRERLTQYDAIQDGSLTAAEAPADTAATDSVTVVEEIPVELRPAE